MSSLDNQIYGLVGYRGVGKDTFAKEVVSRSGKFTILHFAKALRKLCSDVFGVDEESFLDREKKEAKIKSVVIDNYVYLLRQHTGLDIKERGLVAETPRQLLQFVGTDYVRSERDSYWVDKVVEQIKKIGGKVLIADVRFPNEIKAIKDLGGKIIRLNRKDIVPTGQHESDTALAALNPDLDLMLIKGDLKILEMLATTISSGYFNRSAAQYDWRRLEPAMKAYIDGKSLREVGDVLNLSELDKRGVERGIIRRLFDYYSVRVRKNESARSPHITVGGKEGKKCSLCKEEKPLEQFNAHVRMWDGYSSSCRSCQSAWHKKKYSSSQHNLDFVIKNAKRCALQRGLEFTVTEEYLKDLFDKQGGMCSYSGVKLSFEKKDPARATIDRVDSNKGYVVNNVVWCSYRVNIMKGADDVDEFKKWIRMLSEHGTTPIDVGF